jgi:hypothetical protein
MINQLNYKNSTFANFKYCLEPQEKHNYISKSGSFYWIKEDRLIRKSSHWGNLKTCKWLILNKEYHDIKSIVGYCLFSDFKEYICTKNREALTEAYYTNNNKTIRVKFKTQEISNMYIISTDGRIFNKNNLQII